MTDAGKRKCGLEIHGESRPCPRRKTFRPTDSESSTATAACLTMAKSHVRRHTATKGV